VTFCYIKDVKQACIFFANIILQIYYFKIFNMPSIKGPLCKKHWNYLSPNKVTCFLYLVSYLPLNYTINFQIGSRVPCRCGTERPYVLCGRRRLQMRRLSTNIPKNDPWTIDKGRSLNFAARRTRKYFLFRHF